MSKVLEYQAAVDTKQAESDLQGLGDTMQSTAQKGASATKKMNDELGGTAGKTGKAAGGIKGIGDQLGGLQGPIGMAIQGVKGVIQVFNILIMNPIGLIIAAIATALIMLYKAFTSTNDGADKMEQIFAGLGAMLDVIRDRFLKLAGAIGKLFTGDFSGAMEDAKASISGVGDELQKEFNEAAKLAQKLQELEDAERELIKTRATQNRQLAAARLLMEDENASFADRKKALEEVRQGEVALAKQEEDLARQRYEAIKAQNALSDASDEALQKEAEAFAKVEEAATASFMVQKKIAKQLESLQKEEEAKRKAAAEEYRKNVEAIVKISNDLRIALITDEREAEKEKLKLQTEAQVKEINALKTTAANKKKLRAQAVEAERLAMKEIDEKYDKQAEDKKKTDEEKAKTEAKTKHDEELAKFQKSLDE